MNSSKASPRIEDDDNKDESQKTEPSKKDVGQDQRKPSSSKRRPKRSTEGEFPDLFGQPFHLNDDGSVDTTGMLEQKVSDPVVDKQYFDGNICHPAVSFSLSEEGTIEQSASKYRAHLHEYMQRNISDEERFRKYADHHGDEYWGKHADIFSQHDFYILGKAQSWIALEHTVHQFRVIQDNKALTMDMVEKLQEIHKDDQILINQLNEKVRQQDELIKTLTLKAEYNGKSVDALRKVAERQRDRIKQYQEETRALRSRQRREDREFDADELLSTIKPYQEMVASAVASTKAIASKEGSSERTDSSKKENHQKKADLPTNVTWPEFLRIASPSRSPGGRSAQEDDADNTRSRTQTPPPDEQDVIDVDSSPEDAQNDNEGDQSGQQNDDGQLAVNSEGQVVESLNKDNTVPAFSWDPRNILETDCTSEEDSNKLREREASPACVHAFGRARRWSKVTKFRNWLEHTPSDLEKTVTTSEGRRYLSLELEHIQKYLDWANARKYRSASSSSVQSFMSEFQKDRASNGKLKVKYMFLGEKAEFKLRKFAAFDPDTPVIFSYQERIRLIRAALDNNMSDIHLEYFKLFGNRPDKRLSDERFPDHEKPVVPLERVRKRSRSPRERRPPPKRQHRTYVPSARQENQYPPQQRRTSSSYRADHRRNDDKNSRSPPRDSRRRRAPTQDSDQRANETARKHIEERANQIARTIVANPYYLKNYPKIPKMDLDTTMTLLRISKEEAKDKQFEHYRLHLIHYLDGSGSPLPQRPASHHRTSRRTSREEYPRRRDTRSRSPSQGEGPH